MIWSPQQDAALCAVQRWLRSSEPVFRLFGHAGTGKTTLAKHFAASVSGQVLYATFTGKAAHVMRQKGCEGASTIHSLIYRFADKTEKGQPRFVLDEASRLRQASLLIIDEGSMVDGTIGRDLLSFGVPILVLGDPAQLPPINGSGYFDDDEPDYMLTEIQRQAFDNPIVRLATAARNGAQLELGNYGNSRVINGRPVNPAVVDELIAADQVLVGRHRTRRHHTMYMRGTGPSLPFRGDKLVCLRNDYQQGLLNGSLWRVQNVSGGGDDLVLTVAPEEGGAAITLKSHAAFFDGSGPLDYWEQQDYAAFDFGYALTVHKAQGSQWDNVILYDEARYFREHRNRWLYTGITRAAQQITIVRRRGGVS